MAWRLNRTYPDARVHKMARWVCSMMDASTETALKLGRSPEAIIAQAALESAWGQAAIGNNLFGIKADASWRGAVLMRRTAEQREDGSTYWVNAAFRDYPTLAASVEDHFNFLFSNSRYAAAGVFTAKSDHEYFVALKKAGYATDVDYVAKLDATLAAVKRFTADMSIDDREPQPRARLLFVGCIGGDVKELQETLFHKGMLEKATDVDGEFGSVTLAAVKRFQMKSGLEADGIVGDKTQAALHR